MEAPEAIETLEDILRHVEPGDPPEEHEAIQMGIQALGAVQSLEVFIHQLEEDTDLMVMKIDIFKRMNERGLRQ